MEVRWGLRCAVAVVLLASVLGPSMAGAATAGDLDVEKPGAKDAKLESLLSELAARAEARGNAAAVDYARKHSRIHIQAGKVRVVVEASRSGRGGAAEALAARGAVVEAEYADLVQALVAPGALPALASDPRVRWIREPLEPQALGVPGQGVAASGATAWHTAGATGAGARVAVIDVGFAGYTARQAEGDLPASVTTVNYCSGGFTQENHGTAVAEIVHEMAPNAGLTLICIDSEVTLGQAKDYVKAQGIPIVNTSLGWVVSSRGDGSGGPGTPDAIVTDASQSDVLWVTAAGNEADAHWSGTFSDADNDQLNNFSGADEVNNVTVYPGDFVCAELKWDHWPLSNQDYDLYLASGSTTLAGSENPQTGTQPPTEDACWFNSGGSPVSVGLVIRRYSATQTPRFDLWAVNHTLEYRNAAGSINEPASAPGAFAAGAICWQNRALEPYSSQGPTIDARIKPDIAGFAAVSGATYGPFTSCALSGFLGTSAATPHVAGAAALVKGANPAFGAAAIRSFLESRAVDLGPSGKDNTFGYGALALGSLSAPPPAPTPPAPPAPPPSSPPAPPPPPPVADTSAPVARAVASVGARGRIAALRYRIYEASGRTREEIRVFNGTRRIARSFTAMGTTRWGALYSATWRVPRRARPPVTFCVRAWDEPSNVSRWSCAQLRLRG